MYNFIFTESTISIFVLFYKNKTSGYYYYFRKKGEGISPFQ